jgi:hypothetical protein
VIGLGPCCLCPRESVLSRLDIGESSEAPFFHGHIFVL